MDERSKARWTLMLFVGSFVLIGLLIMIFVSTKESPTKTAHKTTTKTETLFEKKSRSMGIVIGTPADDVVTIRGKSPYPTEVMGKDENGLIVEWEYPDGIYVMRRWTINGITCYRVAEMKLEP